jgi:transposase
LSSRAYWCAVAHASKSTRQATKKKPIVPKRFCRRLHKTENFFRRIKDWRRIASRYESFLAAADLGGAFCWVKL